MHEEFANLRRRVRARMKRQAESLAFDYTHVARVAEQADVLADAEEDAGRFHCDRRVLHAAAWLHEIGRGAETHGEALVDATVRVAEEMLRAEKLPELVWPVCEALAEHYGDGRAPTTPEAKVLHDADRLDELGAIGLTRVLIEATQFGGPPALYDVDDPGAEHRPRDPHAWLLDMVAERAATAIEGMQTDAGRERARDGARLLAKFHRAVLRECGAEPNGE